MTDVSLIASEDTNLSLGAQLNNFGVSTTVTIGQYHKWILRFNLSGIPAGSICTAASLKLTNDYGWAGEQTYNCYKIADANGDWIEGTKNDTQAGAGEPCWNAKRADGSGGVTTAWAGSNGMSTAGTDYLATSLGSYTGTNLAGEVPFDIVFNATGLAVLEDWFGDATNNGFMVFKTDTDYINFWFNNAAIEARRPVLSVTYTAGGALLKVNMHAQMQSLTGGFN